MQKLLPFCLLLLASCQAKKNVVDEQWVDSLLSNYHSNAIKRNTNELQFWKDRIKPANPGLVNELRYAATLVQRYHLLGGPADVDSADQLLVRTDSIYAHKESAPKLALFHNYILQHRFIEADSILRDAKANGIKKYESAMSTFDIDLELGRYSSAIAGLSMVQLPNDYGYHFRQSKMQHYLGDLDRSVNEMMQAAGNAGSDTSLLRAALSNAADLMMHAGKAEKAFQLYKQCISLDAADLHCLLGIGWIALVKDRNDSLAERVFEFVHSKTQAPEVLLKLMYVAQVRSDRRLEKKYANEFVAQVSNTSYGNMYNKYLVEIFTSVLNDAAHAESIARRELKNRATPQTYAWLVWSLFCNNKRAGAAELYEKHVSGKPLESTELYWMGRYMQDLGKKYNAGKYFEAAMQNRYDLAPAFVEYIKRSTE